MDMCGCAELEDVLAHPSSSLGEEESWRHKGWKGPPRSQSPTFDQTPPCQLNQSRVPVLHGCKSPEPHGCEGKTGMDSLLTQGCPSLQATAASSQPLGLPTTFI